MPVVKRVLPWQPMEDQYSPCARGEEGTSLAAYGGSIFTLCLWRRGFFLGSLCRINIHVVPVVKRVLPWQPMEDQYSRCACGEEGTSLAAYGGSIFMMSNADSPNRPEKM